MLFAAAHSRDTEKTSELLRQHIQLTGRLIERFLRRKVLTVRPASDSSDDYRGSAYGFRKVNMK